jgi:alpha-D-xyloside xylohydrolase
VWTNLLSGQKVEGPGWIQEKHDFLSLPLLVRPNTVLPVSSRTDRPDFDYSQDVILKIFELEKGKDVRAEIPSTEGKIESFIHVRRENDVIDIDRQGPSKPWQILLLNIHSIETDQDFATTAEGLLVSPGPSTNSVKIRVREE